MTQSRCQSTANRSDAWRRHQIGNGRRHADRRPIMQIVMMMVIVQVIIRVGLAGRDVAVRCAVVVGSYQVLQAQTRRVRHLVEAASIHHRQRVEWWKDLLIWSNVNCFKSVLDTFAAELCCSRHFLEKLKRFALKQNQKENFASPVTSHSSCILEVSTSKNRRREINYPRRKFNKILKVQGEREMLESKKWSCQVIISARWAEKQIWRYFEDAFN